MCQMRTTTCTNYFISLEQESVILLLWKLREVQSRFLWVPMNSHKRNTETHRAPKRLKKTVIEADKQTETNTHTHTHTHLGGRSATYWAHLGGSHVMSLGEAQVLHTHRCPHGVNKCVCMLAHH